MAIGSHIQAWRLARKLSVDGLAAKTGLSAETLEALEAGTQEPSLSLLEAVAGALDIPVPWLFGDPALLDLLRDPDEPSLRADSVDPALERVLATARQEPELYTLLTALVHSGDPRLIQAAGVNLRSLLKQARQATVPWQSRPPGHFEPPSD
jgi:transcriptional regulator with XRE-family HTH domain